MSEAIEAPVLEGQQAKEPTFSVGLTPLGRPAVNIDDGQGNVAGYVFSSPEELNSTVGHLQALATMMIQGMYAQKMEEQRQAASLLQQTKVGTLWTPPS